MNGLNKYFMTRSGTLLFLYMFCLNLNEGSSPGTDQAPLLFVHFSHYGLSLNTTVY